MDGVDNEHKNDGTQRVPKDDRERMVDEILKETQSPQQTAGQEQTHSATQEETQPKKETFQLYIEDEEYHRLPDYEKKPVSKSGVTGEGNTAPGGKAKKKKKRHWIKVLVVSTIIVVASLALSIVCLISVQDILGINKADTEIDINIPYQSSTAQIADILEENGVIEYPWLFRVISKMSGADGQYQYGIYTLRPNMAYEEIIRNLKQISDRRNDIRIQVTEGMTINEVAKLLEENKVCEAKSFIHSFNNASFGYSFEEQINENPLKFYKMEGYLFPDTYFFFEDQNVETVCEKFLKNFNDKITPALYQRMEDMNMTLEETLTLASLIQAEAGGTDQMKEVSGVFYNRLHNPEAFPKLESDVTIQYVEEDIKPNIQLPNQDMYDVYNTYKCQGLPVGPICNPGLEAIEAALYPADHTYYFFVTDLRGQFYYAQTLAEHNQNIQVAEQVNAQVQSEAE